MENILSIVFIITLVILGLLIVLLWTDRLVYGPLASKEQLEKIRQIFLSGENEVYAACYGLTTLSPYGYIGFTLDSVLGYYYSGGNYYQNFIVPRWTQEYKEIKELLKTSKTVEKYFEELNENFRQEIFNCYKKEIISDLKRPSFEI
jgi:hypothetical protein